MEDKKNQPEKNKEESTYLSFCLCIGMVIGIGIGVALDNMTTFLCIGISLGVAVGAMLDAKHRKENSASENVKGNEQIQD